jgi:hypothetical protein
VAVASIGAATPASAADLTLGDPSLAAAAGDAVDPSSLTPPAPDPYSCRALPTGQIRCDFDLLIQVDPFPTGLICGDGVNVFEVWDGGEAIRTIATRFYDDQGRIVRRILHETYLGASFQNPQTGASVRYRQSNTILDTYAVPGDVTSATEATVGNAGIVLLPGSGAIVLNAGRTVWAFDPTLGDLGLLSSAGPQAFVRAFVEGDLSVLQPICDALDG